MFKFVRLWNKHNLATMTTTATSASTTSTESKAASGGSLVAAVQPGGQHDAGGGDVNREQIYQWWVISWFTLRQCWVGSELHLCVQQQHQQQNLNFFQDHWAVVSRHPWNSVAGVEQEARGRPRPGPDAVAFLWHHCGTPSSTILRHDIITLNMTLT